MRPTRGRKIEYEDEFEHENDYGNDCETADPQMRPGAAFGGDRRVRCFLDAVVQQFVCTLQLQHEPGTDGVPETRRRLSTRMGYSFTTRSRIGNGLPIPLSIIQTFRVDQKRTANISNSPTSTNHLGPLARYRVIYKFRRRTNHHDSTILSVNYLFFS